MSVKETPSQTAGPYLHIGCASATSGVMPGGVDLGSVMRTGPVVGEEIVIHGRIFDGSGAPVTDAMVEIWQADSLGFFAGQGGDDNLTGFGRCTTHPTDGSFRFETVKPGRVPGPDGA